VQSQDLRSEIPLTQTANTQTPEQVIHDWQPAVGLDDVALLEYLLDEALAHLGKILTLLPSDSSKATNARTFLAQFRQP